MKNPFCNLVETKMSESALRGEFTSRLLTGHLKRCRRCMARFQAEQAIIERLNGLKQEATTSNRFSDNAWNRLQVRQSARLLTSRNGFVRATGFVLTAATCATLAYLFSPSHSERGLYDGASPMRKVKSMVARIDPTLEANAQKQVRNGKRAPQISRTGSRYTGAQPVVTSSAKKNVKHKRRQITKGKTMLAKHESSLKMYGPNAVQSGSAAKADPVTTWKRWAEYYESRGDYRAAEAAYASALEKSPDPNLTFNAGRTAECAGDVVQAVDYYTRILKQVSQTEHQPKKGSILWTDDFVTA
jgi:predicted Zn-dependent protease